MTNIARPSFTSAVAGSRSVGALRTRVSLGGGTFIDGRKRPPARQYDRRSASGARAASCRRTPPRAGSALSFGRSYANCRLCSLENPPISALPVIPARTGSSRAPDAAAGRRPRCCLRGTGSWLRRWARGRLPLWARGTVDTRRSGPGHPARAVRAARPVSSRNSPVQCGLCLRRAIENRIRDQLRRATRRRNAAMPAERVVPGDGSGAPASGSWLTMRTVAALPQRPAASDGPVIRRLIVGRTELEYNFRQLALVEGLPSPDAARMALRRALVRLSDAIEGAGRSAADIVVVAEGARPSCDSSVRIRTRERHYISKKELRQSRRACMRAAWWLLVTLGLACPARVTMIGTVWSQRWPTR